MLKWIKRIRSSNSSDNNIQINTNTDTMFNIGKDLGEIKVGVLNTNLKIELMENKINENTKKIKKIEKIIYKNKNLC